MSREYFFPAKAVDSNSAPTGSEKVSSVPDVPGHFLVKLEKSIIMTRFSPEKKSVSLSVLLGLCKTQEHCLLEWGITSLGTAEFLRTNSSKFEEVSYFLTNYLKISF